MDLVMGPLDHSSQRPSFCHDPFKSIGPVLGRNKRTDKLNFFYAWASFQWTVPFLAWSFPFPSTVLEEDRKALENGNFTISNQTTSDPPKSLGRFNWK